MINSNIEINNYLNPIYYSLPYEDETEKKKEIKQYECFKNINANLNINFEGRIKKDIYNDKYSDSYDDFYLNGDYLKQLKQLEKNESKVTDKSESKGTDKNDSIYIYIDSYDNDNSLYYKKTKLKEIYDFFNTNKDNNFLFKIRVFSKNKSITKETLKKTIDLDIDSIFKRLQRYEPGNEIKKINLITDYDGNLDYLCLNIETIKGPSEKKRYIELVDYANKKLKEEFSKEKNLINVKDGKEIGKVKFFVTPNVIKPAFLDKDKPFNSFDFEKKEEEEAAAAAADAAATAAAEKEKISKLKNLKILFHKIDLNFKKYIKELKEKYIRGEVIKQLEDFLDKFYILELYPGINGDNLINLTQERHSKSFKYKKNNKAIIKLNALDVDLLVKLKEITPSNIYVFKILHKKGGGENEIGEINVKIDYGEKENRIEIQKISLIDKNYSDFFKMKGDDSSLEGRKGVIKRKTRIVKRVLQIEPYNIGNVNVDKKLYIIPLISFDDKDVANYLNKSDPDKYVINNDDLLGILTDMQKSYQFYLSVSSNNDSKVYDTQDYSDTFKKTKKKENVKYILSKLLEIGKVFRPKKIQGQKDFKGIYKILGYEIDESKDNYIRIIDKGDFSKKNESNIIKGRYIKRSENNNLKIQINAVTFKYVMLTSFDGLSDNKDYKFEITNDDKIIIHDKNNKIVKKFKKKQEVFQDESHKNYDGIDNKDKLNLIRVPIKLYISQNPPKDHKDLKCMLQKEMIGKAFEKLEISFNDLKGKRMPGYYPENQPEQAAS